MKGCLVLILLSAAGIIVKTYAEDIKLPEDFTIPYMAYIESSAGHCVGSLIDPEWVLTAAHCLKPIKIRLGVYQPNIINKKEQTHNYSLIVTHPEFDAQSLRHNLMMIKLSKVAALNYYVGTIAIAMEPIPYNDSCFIPTWTWSEYKNSSEPDILTWINQYILPTHKCKDKLYQKEEMMDNIMCIGNPLDIISKIKEVPAAPAVCIGRLHGILSWAKAGFTLGNEAFFTDIRYYARWIIKVMSSY